MKKEIFRILLNLHGRVSGAKNRLKTLELEEWDDHEGSETTEDFDKLSHEIIVFIQKFTKLVEKNSKKINEFNKIRAQFTEVD